MNINILFSINFFNIPTHIIDHHITFCKQFIDEIRKIANKPLGRLRFSICKVKIN